MGQQICGFAGLQLEIRVRNQAHRGLRVGCEVCIAHRVSVLDILRDEVGVDAIHERLDQFGAGTREAAGEAVGKQRPRRPHDAPVDHRQASVANPRRLLNDVDPPETLHGGRGQGDLKIRPVHRRDAVGGQSLRDVVVYDGTGSPDSFHAAFGDCDRGAVLGNCHDVSDGKAIAVHDDRPARFGALVRSRAGDPASRQQRDGGKQSRDAKHRRWHRG